MTRSRRRIESLELQVSSLQSALAMASMEADVARSEVSLLKAERLETNALVLDLHRELRESRLVASSSETELARLLGPSIELEVARARALEAIGWDAAVEARVDEIEGAFQ